jgi:hypothetical protein
MKLFAAVYHDARLLGHFLAHYHKAGVTEFFIAVNDRFRSTVAGYSTSYNVTIFDELDVSDTVIGEVSAVTELRHRHQGPDEWVIIVDLDEFVEFPKNLDDIIKHAEGENANVVRATMWDRFSKDGLTVGFNSSSDLSQVYPIRAPFIKNIMQGADYKGVLVKGLLKSWAAHHIFEEEKICSLILDISHYKWTEGAIDRLKVAHQMVLETGQPWAVEYGRVLDHYETHGRFAWEEFGGEFVFR